MQKLFLSLLISLFSGPVLMGEVHHIDFDRAHEFYDQIEKILSKPEIVEELCISRTSKTFEDVDRVDFSILARFENLKSLTFTTPHYPYDDDPDDGDSEMGPHYLDQHVDEQMYTILSIPPLQHLEKLAITNAYIVKQGLEVPEMSLLLAWITQFSELRVLDLSKNFDLLHNFPGDKEREYDFSTLGVLKKLQELNLNATDCTDLNQGDQLKGLDQLSGLKKVSFAGNSCNESYRIFENACNVLSTFFKLKNLEELDISATFYHIDNVVPQFTPLNSLRKLHLKHLHLSTLDFSHLFPQLEWLDFSGSFLSEVDLKALGKFKSLKHLDFLFTNLSNAQILELQNADPLINLEWLNLTWIRSHGLDFSSFAPNLKTLNLACSYVNNEDIDSILSLKSLECLIVAGTQIDGRGITRLAALPSLKALEAMGLDLTNVDFSDFSKLEYLDIFSFWQLGNVNSIGSLNCLRYLRIGNANLCDADFSELTHLEYLNFNCARLSPKFLVSIQNLQTLKELVADESDLSGFDFSGLRQLEHLSLYLASVSPDFWESLLDLKTLKTLDVRLEEGCDLPADNVAKLRAALPKCKILDWHSQSHHGY